MPLTVAVNGINNIMRIASLLLTTLFYNNIRPRLARREAWFSCPSLTEGDRAAAHADRKGFLSTLTGSLSSISSNVTCIVVWLSQLVNAINEDANVELTAHLTFGMCCILTLNTSIRSLYHTIQSKRAAKEEACEAQHYMARLSMLDGAYVPVLVLAYGGDSAGMAVRHAHATQSLVWAVLCMISLFDSQMVAKSASDSENRLEEYDNRALSKKLATV